MGKIYLASPRQRGLVHLSPLTMRSVEQLAYLKLKEFYSAMGDLSMPVRAKHFLNGENTSPLPGLLTTGNGEPRAIEVGIAHGGSAIARIGPRGKARAALQR